MTVADVLALALRDAGVGVVSYVPGYGGSDIYRALKQNHTIRVDLSFHEEPAYTIAHGAAVCGMRSACLFKTHGLMKAANSVSDSLFAGTTAGFVVVVSEDKGGTHSDSINEAVPFLKGIGMPCIEASPGNEYLALMTAFELSEKEKLPYALVVDVERVKSEAPQPLPRFLPPVPVYRRNPAQFVLAPLFNPYQRKVYEARITGGDPLRIPVPKIPRIPEETPPNWRKIVEGYVPFFRVFKDFRGDFVTGDTGVSSQFSAAPWHCIDLVTYMGGSIPLAIGAHMAGMKNVWAVTGDFSFIAAGTLGLLESTLRKIPLKVIIFDNGMAATTGGQPIPDGILEHVLSPYFSFVRRLSDFGDEAMMGSMLKEASEAQETRIILVNCRDRKD